MNRSDVTNARLAIGHQWGLGRGLSLSEMARALRLSSGDAVRDIERGHQPVSGPVSALIELYLSGVKPP